MKKSSADQILLLLKMRGELDCAFLSEELQISKEGVRQHLIKLRQEGLLDKVCKSNGVGRPFTYYSLSKLGRERFPDRHDDVAVQLIDSVKNLLGENALELLITDREKLSYERYANKIKEAKTIEEKLAILSHVRTEEGYMAEWKKEGETYYFIENHCPICAAATACQQFCQAELRNFKALFGPECHIVRTKHILADEQRCVYQLQKIPQN